MTWPCCYPTGAPTLRPRNVAPSTIASYIRTGENLFTWLGDAGTPTTASGIARSTWKRSWPRWPTGSPAATAATHYRSLQQLFR